MMCTCSPWYALVGYLRVGVKTSSDTRVALTASGCIAGASFLSCWHAESFPTIKYFFQFLLPGLLQVIMFCVKFCSSWLGGVGYTNVFKLFAD